MPARTQNTGGPRAADFYYTLNGAIYIYIMINMKSEYPLYLVAQKDESESDI
jgi:hypothetical protein